MAGTQLGSGNNQLVFNRGTQPIAFSGAATKSPTQPILTGGVQGGAVLPQSGSNTVNSASKIAGVGGTVLSNTSHVLAPYNGHYKNFGSLPNPGLSAKQVDYQITDTNGTANDKWFLYDFNGLSGKTNASTISIGVTSNVLLSATAGYTALKSYYATGGLNPCFNSVRIQGDSSVQIAQPINFSYYDENSNVVQTKQVTPSNAFNQGDYQNSQGEFGVQCAITSNFVMYGSIVSSGATSNYIAFTLYMQDYVGERYYAGAR